MQKLQISIPEPCHENWQNMTPSDQGRFCNACAKTVVDFSMMSDYEVLNYFSTVSDEKVCGRTLATQLNREMTMPREPKKRRFWYWNYVAMFFMLFSKSNQVKAQGGVRAVEIPVKKPTCNNVVGTMLAHPLKAQRVVSGIVTDDKGSPIAGAAIRIRGAQTGVSADGNGNYSIKVKDGDVLEFSGTGYERLGQAIRYNTTRLDVVLLSNGININDVVVIAGGISRRSVELGYFGDINTRPNQVCEIKVREQGTGNPLKNAALVIKKNGTSVTERSLTDRFGIYKLKKIKDGELYKITVSADGYEDQELDVRGVRTDPGKISKEVLLVKKPEVKTLDNVTVTAFATQRKTIMLGQTTTTKIDTNVQVTQAKIKNEAVSMGAVVSGIQVNLVQPREKKSIIKTIARKVTDTLSFTRPTKINLYPNPVRSGRPFLVSLGLQQGEMQIQITDLNGRVVLQKQITTSSKDHLEKIETDDRWPAGMYFLNVYNSNGGQQGKLINVVSFVVQ